MVRVTRQRTLVVEHCILEVFHFLLAETLVKVAGRTVGRIALHLHSLIELAYGLDVVLLTMVKLTDQHLCISTLFRFQLAHTIQVSEQEIVVFLASRVVLENCTGQLHEDLSVLRQNSRSFFHVVYAEVDVFLASDL